MSCVSIVRFFPVVAEFICCTLILLLTSCAAGESIPIRLFLAGYEMTPTMRDINKKFSVRYYLNLVLIDEEERRYFKQQVCTSHCSLILAQKLSVGDLRLYTRTLTVPAIFGSFNFLDAQICGILFCVQSE